MGFFTSKTDEQKNREALARAEREFRAADKAATKAENEHARLEGIRLMKPSRDVIEKAGKEARSKRAVADTRYRAYRDAERRVNGSKDADAPSAIHYTITTNQEN